MAYNLQSLITILQQLLNPEETRWIVTDNKQQLESLLQKAVSLKQNIEKNSGPKVEDLESGIRDAACKAEDIIECHLVDQVLLSAGGVRFTFTKPDLQQVVEEFDSIIEGRMKTSTGSSSSGAAFLPDHPSSKNILVGVDKDLMQLKDRLTGQERKREIVPIVGMGGIDDMWSTDAWDVIRRCFPNNHNGSQIVLTTRESGVAKYVGAQSLQHKVQLMNKSESWNLLHKIVFGEEDCPNTLEGIGRDIASDCGGLPLAINVIGGLLSKAERSIDVWEHIANDVNVAITKSNDDQFSNVLSLSYNHLPNHLKPCFLYMGAFPEDYHIKVSRLTRICVAEGFVKANGDKSLEEEAEDYLRVSGGEESTCGYTKQEQWKTFVLWHA